MICFAWSINLLHIHEENVNKWWVGAFSQCGCSPPQQAYLFKSDFFSPLETKSAFSRTLNFISSSSHFLPTANLFCSWEVTQRRLMEAWRRWREVFHYLCSITLGFRTFKLPRDWTPRQDKDAKSTDSIFQAKQQSVDWVQSNAFHQSDYSCGALDGCGADDRHHEHPSDVHNLLTSLIHQTMQDLQLNKLSLQHHWSWFSNLHD